MARALRRTTTTTVTEEFSLMPEAAGAEQKNRYLKVGGMGIIRDGGQEVYKPCINLNTKWLYEAGFHAGDSVEVAVRENELVIRKMAEA